MTHAMRWLAAMRTSPDPRARVIGCPFAGGGTSVFRSWPSAFDAGIDIHALQLPGREARIGESPDCALAEIVAGVLTELAMLPPCPAFLVGHSMGALIAFEVAHALQDAGSTQVQAVVVGARGAPHCQDTMPMMYTLPRQALVSALIALNGIEPEIAASEEMLDLVLPALRADFRLAQTYRYRPRPPLKASLLALGGTDDDHVPLETVAQWDRHTSGRFSCQQIDGDHFFILKKSAVVTSLVRHEIDTTLRLLPVRDLG